MKTIYKSCYFLLLLLPFSILAQNTLSGTVLDKSSGQPIQVNVNVQGSTNGVSTDFDGKFQLPNAKKGAKIVFLSLVTKHSHYMMLKISNGFTRRRCKSINEVVIQVG
jgi:iron complex outermembrane receptor protein